MVGIFPGDSPCSLYPFPSTADSQTWRDEVVNMEYERMGMGPSGGTGLEARPWRITQCNDKYKYGQSKIIKLLFCQNRVLFW